MSGSGWSDPGAGPDGLAPLVVAGLHLPAAYYVAIRGSFWLALGRMYADPRWRQIASEEDARRLVTEYL
jgi:hypothetical protein